MEHEYNWFCEIFNCHIPYVKVENALEMAKLINSSTMVVGNQTSTTTISESLKKTMFLEIRRDVGKTDCIFNRPNLFYI